MLPSIPIAVDRSIRALEQLCTTHVRVGREIEKKHAELKEGDVIIVVSLRAAAPS